MGQLPEVRYSTLHCQNQNPRCLVREPCYLEYYGLTMLRWFALVRIWVPWLGPRHGQSKFELDKDAILCSFLNPEGRHLVLLAISGANNVISVFRHNDSGGVTVRVGNTIPNYIEYSALMLRRLAVIALLRS